MKWDHLAGRMEHTNGLQLTGSLHLRCCLLMYRVWHSGIKKFNCQLSTLAHSTLYFY